MKKAILLLMLIVCAGFFSQAKAQENEPDEFKFHKTIDQVDIYFLHSNCSEGEFLLIKAINTGTDQVSLNLQPIWSYNDDFFQSTTSITINLNGNSEIIGGCDNPELKISIYEFFSMYDAETMSLDLIKN